MEPILSDEMMNEVLFQAMRAVYRFEREKVAAFDLDYGAIYLLQYLRRNAKAPVTQIAQEMRLPISTVSRMAGRLEKRGLVWRAEDAEDRRRVLVSLDPRGESLVREVEEHSASAITKNIETIATEKLDALVTAARLLPVVLGISDEF